MEDVVIHVPYSKRSAGERQKAALSRRELSSVLEMAKPIIKGTRVTSLTVLASHAED